MTQLGYASTPPCLRYSEAERAGLRAVPEGVVWAGRRCQAAELANQPMDEDQEGLEDERMKEEGDIEDRGAKEDEETGAQEDEEDNRQVRGGQRSETEHALEARLKKVKQELQTLKALLQDRAVHEPRGPRIEKEEPFALPQSMDGINL